MLFSRLYLSKNIYLYVSPKNIVQCYNKNTLLSFKRLLPIRNMCINCLDERHISGKGNLSGLSIAYANFGNVNAIRSQSTQLRLDEHKLEQFLKNVSWDVLKSNYDIHVKNEKSIISLLKEKERLEENVKELESMKEKEANKENNKEMAELIECDLAQYKSELAEIYEEIIDIILPRGDFDDCNDVVLEISAGVGGSEAQLFASDLYEMYVGFIDSQGWECHTADYDTSELGGVRHCSLLVSGQGAFRTLQHEAGVHRVQRVPETEKAGRMHTSTVTVAVLPQPTDVEIEVKESDLKIETKRASGAGGQHVNTTDSAVRISHLPSGIVVECQTDRNQSKNRETALKKLKAKLYERELNKIDSQQRSQRKTQVGTSARSEKIRTYNFRDDRISDHRLSVNLHNLKDFLQGGAQFERLLQQLIEKHHESQMKQFIDSLPGQ